ncbi:MAG: molybdopterin-dependent oxidoreductase, partial [Pseudomonadota bacterium]|nr:molybdopterin-dependent oxidoreductase [Pseudomonadota bacterium]
MSAEDKTRRNVLKGSMLAAGVAAAPSFILPVLAQGERLVPFTDVPDSFQVNPVQPDTTHWQDTREIDEFVTDNDDFYLVQHYGQPDIEKDTWRLRVTGMVDNELEFNLSELMNRETIERQIGFECGGNSQRLFHGLIGNADWRGVSLRDILQQAGIQEGAKEIV